MTDGGTPLTMGAVVDLLAEEFPDLTASKIRYLEAEGVIHPHRTPRGSRRFTDDDVRRLRHVLRLQRDEYLPLRVIRENLAAMPSDAAEAAPSVPSQRLRRGRPRTMTVAELCERAGISRATLEELERYGLIANRDSQALDICVLVGRLAEFGIEPRHLRASRVAADREIGLVEQALAPRRGDAIRDADDRGQLLALLIDLHIALVRAGVPG